MKAFYYKVRDIVVGFFNLAFKKEDAEIIARGRLEDCSMCMFKNKHTCGECGCYLKAKARCITETNDCPLGKWKDEALLMSSGLPFVVKRLYAERVKSLNLTLKRGKKPYKTGHGYTPLDVKYLDSFENLIKNDVFKDSVSMHNRYKAYIELKNVISYINDRFYLRGVIKGMYIK